MTKDPKAVTKTEQNSSCPCTQDEILTWFEGRDNQEHVKLLVEHGSYANYPLLWNHILDINLGSTSSKNMWITPKGKIWSCNYANHARVANLMGLTEGQLEKAGWVKVSYGTAYGEIRPTSKQARILNEGQIRISQMLMEASMKSTPRKPQEIWE